MVSVIIVNYNTKELTKDCVTLVMEKTEGVEFDICVVDNASADDSAGELRRAFPGIKVIESRTNGGFARANNLAIRETRADYVFLLNSDTVLVNNAVRVLLEFMERQENRDVACCGGSLCDERMMPRPSYGNFPSLTGLAFKVFSLSKVFRRYYREKLRPSSKVHGSSALEVDYIMGADMFIRRSVLDEVGLFDEEFFLYFEDTELSYRMFRSGYRSMIVPQARIIHLSGMSGTDATEVESARVRERSKFLFFRKCYGKKAAFLAKLLHLVQYGRRFLLGFDRKSREMIGIIWKA